MHVGIFDLEHVKVIWGHSVHFSENWVVTQKRLIVETDENWSHSVYFLKKRGRDSITAHHEVKRMKIAPNVVCIFSRYF